MAEFLKGYSLMEPCDQVADRYEGQTAVNGQKNGRGKLVKRDGSIEDGLWYEDKLVKVCHEPPIQVTSPHKNNPHL